MKVHHINCGTMCPFGGKFMDGVSGWLDPARIVCHCLLVETDEGLVLVDTGLGVRDIEEPHRRLSAFFRTAMRVQLNPTDTALAQVKKLGFKASDVRHIVLTHLDFDHAGGIEDFPQAKVHLYRREMNAARHRDTFIDRGRYRPQQWDDDVQWRLYDEKGEPWHGFESIRNLEGLPPEILLVPLIGHTWGHCGVAVQGDSGWLLHAGDAYFYRDEVHARTPHCTPGLRAYQTMMEVDRKMRLRNQARLHDLAQAGDNQVTVFCAHDCQELARLS
jgi:glyoxylase-like metal-dependent hydrolase (beta-lactamase superfamily II)